MHLYYKYDLPRLIRLRAKVLHDIGTATAGLQQPSSRKNVHSVERWLRLAVRSYETAVLDVCQAIRQNRCLRAGHRQAISTVFASMLHDCRRTLERHMQASLYGECFEVWRLLAGCKRPSQGLLALPTEVLALVLQDLPGHAGRHLYRWPLPYMRLGAEKLVGLPHKSCFWPPQRGCIGFAAKAACAARPPLLVGGVLLPAAQAGRAEPAVAYAVGTGTAGHPAHSGPTGPDSGKHEGDKDQQARQDQHCRWYVHLI